MAEFAPLSATVVALFHGDSQVDAVNSDLGQCGLVLDRTLFYSESGGQLSDHGTVFTDKVCIESICTSALSGLLYEKF